MRRQRGQAAELILNVIIGAHPAGVALAQLPAQTGLPPGTIQDNVKALRKQGKIETFKDDNRAVWICLPE